MSFAIGIAIISCLVGCYISACNVAIKGLSRKRFADTLVDRGHSDRYERYIRRMPSLLLMSGTLRACLSLVVLLATLYELDSRLGQDVGTAQERLGLYLLSFLIGGSLVSVFMVGIPSSWAKYQRESLVAMSMPVLMMLSYVMWPVTGLLHAIDPIVRRVSGVDLNEDGKESDISDELLAAVEDHEASGDVQEEQKDMLAAVFELPDTEAGEIMTPRTDIKGIEADAALPEVKQQVIGIGHSRIPVYEESLDHIIGILYAKDLIQFLGDGKEFELRKIVRESFLVPESKSVSQLLEEFKTKQVHMAIVVDEYGGTAGLITIEDILEEIVGEIQDEYELTETPPQITRIDQDTIEVDARVEVDTLNDEMDMNIPEDEDYDTLGGFVFASLEHIPEVGESFRFDDMTFEVIEAERTRVTRVRITGLAKLPVVQRDEAA